MKIAAQLILCFLLVLSFGIAQDNQPPFAANMTSPVLSYQPQYFVAATVGFQNTATPQATGGLTFGVRVREANFTYTTLTMTGKTSTLGQGFGRYLIQVNGFTLAALADIGVSTGNDSVGSALGMGGSISYNISRWTKVPHSAFVATVKCDKSGSADVKPVLTFGVLLGLGQ